MRKPTFILDAGPNTVVGTRAKVMEAVRGGYTKFVYAEKRPHGDLPWSTLVLSRRRIYPKDNPNALLGETTQYVREKDQLRRISDRQQFQNLSADEFDALGEA